MIIVQKKNYSTEQFIWIWRFVCVHKTIYKQITYKKKKNEYSLAEFWIKCDKIDV